LSEIVSVSLALGPGTALDPYRAGGVVELTYGARLWPRPDRRR
jgi:hypothetical protein